MKSDCRRPSQNNKAKKFCFWYLGESESSIENLPEDKTPPESDLALDTFTHTALEQTKLCYSLNVRKCSKCWFDSVFLKKQDESSDTSMDKKEGEINI